MVYIAGQMSFSRPCDTPKTNHYSVSPCIWGWSTRFSKEEVHVQLITEDDERLEDLKRSWVELGLPPETFKDL